MRAFGIGADILLCRFDRRYQHYIKVKAIQG